MGSGKHATEVRDLREGARALGNVAAKIIDEKDAEIERLTERCGAYKGQVKDGAVVIERLRAAIKTTQCPRPANAVPPHITDWTVADCLASGDCGCDLGTALNQQLTQEK